MGDKDYPPPIRVVAESDGSVRVFCEGGPVDFPPEGPPPEEAPPLARRVFEAVRDLRSEFRAE